MKRISIDGLKRRLSSYIDQAAGGDRILIIKYRRPIASLSPAPTRGAYMRVLTRDRRPHGRAS